MRSHQPPAGSNGFVNSYRNLWIFHDYESRYPEQTSLEQVDRMMEETTPRNSSKWVPHSTFAGEAGATEKGTLNPELVQDVERRASVK